MSDAALPIWVSGRFVGPADHALAATDRALVGIGVFEALKMVDGVAFAKRRHLERLVRSGEGAGVAVDLGEVDAGIAAVESSPAVRGRRLWLRITVTGGPAPMGRTADTANPTVVVATSPLPDRDDASDVVIVPWRRNERGALAGLKTTSYLENAIALDHARAQGADEGVFANTAGNLCEGTGTNVFVVHDGALVTPPLGAGPLNGVTRQLLLEWMPEIVERELSIDEFQRCDEAFLTSTSRDVHPIRTIDRRALPVVGGDRTAAAMRCFAERSTADVDP